MYRITRHLMAFVGAVLLTMSMTSCIYDKYDTAQFNISVTATDNDGKKVSPYAMQGQHLYFFLNDRYVDELTADMAGYYHTSMGLGNEIKFVRTIDVNALQKQVDDLSRDLRELDSKLQQANWMTELV